MNLEVQRSQYIRPKVTVHKGAETIQGRNLYEEIWYIKLQIVLSVRLKKVRTLNSLLGGRVGAIAPLPPVPTAMIAGFISAMPITWP